MGTRLILLGLLLLNCLSAWPNQGKTVRAPEASGRKVALVIGNADYRDGKLTNPVNDAAAIRSALRQDGFIVYECCVNVGFEKMSDAIEDWMDGLQPGDVALFYYSGHGFSVGNDDYLVPTDYPSTTRSRDVRFHAFPIQRLVMELSERGTQANLVFIDACRSNRFSGGKGFSTGLSQPVSGTGTYVLYAAAAGKIADDNSAGANSLFTTAVLDGLRQDSISAKALGHFVQDRVFSLSHNTQLPSIADNMSGDVTFGALSKPLPMPVVVPSAASPIPPVAAKIDVDLAALNSAMQQANVNPGTAIKQFLTYSNDETRGRYGDAKWRQDLWSLMLSARLKKLPASLPPESLRGLSGLAITSDGRHLIGCQDVEAPAIEVFDLTPAVGRKGKHNDFPLPMSDFQSCWVSEEKGAQMVAVTVKQSDGKYQAYLIDLSLKAVRLVKEIPNTIALFMDEDFVLASGKHVGVRRGVNLDIEVAGVELPEAITDWIHEPIPKLFGRNIPNFNHHISLGVDAQCNGSCKLYTALQPTLDGNPSLSGRTISVNTNFASVDSISAPSRVLAAKASNAGNIMLISDDGNIYIWDRSFLRDCCGVDVGDFSIEGIAAGQRSAVVAVLHSRSNSGLGRQLALFRDRAKIGTSDLASLAPVSSLSFSPSGKTILLTFVDHTVQWIRLSAFGKNTVNTASCDLPAAIDETDNFVACVDPQSEGEVMFRIDGGGGRVAVPDSHKPNDLLFVGRSLYSLNVFSDRNQFRVVRTGQSDMKVEDRCTNDLAMSDHSSERFFLIRNSEQPGVPRQSQGGFANVGGATQIPVEGCQQGGLSSRVGILKFRSNFPANSDFAVNTLNNGRAFAAQSGGDILLFNFDVGTNLTLGPIPGGIDHVVGSNEGDFVAFNRLDEIYQLPVSAEGLRLLAQKFLETPASFHEVK